MDSYVDWIRYNEWANERKALLVTLSVLGTVAGALTLCAGVVTAFTGSVLLPALVALSTLAVLAGLANLPARLRRLLRESTGHAEATVPRSAEGSETSVAGQRTFEGCDRE